MSQTSRKIFHRVVSFAKCQSQKPYTEKIEFNGQIFHSTIRIEDKTLYHWVHGTRGESHKFSYNLSHFNKYSDLLTGISAIYVPSHDDEFETSFKNGQIICINQPLDYFKKSHLDENQLFNYSVEIMVKRELNYDYETRKQIEFVRV